MQAPSVVFGMMLILVSSPTWAAESWENCLDKVEYSFNVDVDLFKGSTHAGKAGCKMTFSVSGGKGESYELDLCDSNIHIDHKESLDGIAKRIEAGSAGCPAPLFGADFDANSKDIHEYKDARSAVFNLWSKVKDFYGDNKDRHGLTWDKVDIKKPPLLIDGKLADEDSPYRIACGEYLLKEYLTSCMSFEGRKQEPTTTGVKSSIPGIHDQTILAPKK